jgi:hypothetical protein
VKKEGRGYCFDLQNKRRKKEGEENGGKRDVGG